MSVFIRFVAAMMACIAAWIGFVGSGPAAAAPVGQAATSGYENLHHVTCVTDRDPGRGPPCSASGHATYDAVERWPRGASTRIRAAVESCLLPGARSFGGSTLILMADGSRKPIEEIEPGDEVMASDPETAAQGARKVTHVWAHRDDLFEFEVDCELIVTTEDHPFWSVTCARSTDRTRPSSSESGTGQRYRTGQTREGTP